MLIQRPDGEPRGLLDAVEAERRLRCSRRGRVVAALEVRARFVHGGKAGAERRGGLRRLSGGLFLGGPLDEFPETNIVLPRLGQQRRTVLLGKQAWLADGAISDSHECFSTLLRKKKKETE